MGLGGELLRAEVDGGRTVDLVRLRDGAQQIAESIKRNPGAALQVLADRVAAGRLAVFELQPGGNRYAVPVGAGRVWQSAVEARPRRVEIVRAGHRSPWAASVDFDPPPRVRILPAVVGRAGLTGFDGLSSMLRAAADDALGAELLAHWRLALRADDVQGLAAELVRSIDLAPDPRIVQPTGGDWCRDAGLPWTSAKREAMFRMRHQKGMTREEIAEVVRVSGQRVDQLIGSARSIKAKNPTWPKDWAPSAALLLECGAPPQPLQTVAATLGDSAAPAAVGNNARR